MERYGTIMNAACWAAAICGFLGKVGHATDGMELARAREEYCVVVMGQEVDRLAGRVGTYLAAYRTVLGPAIASAEVQ